MDEQLATELEKLSKRVGRLTGVEKLWTAARKKGLDQQGLTKQQVKDFVAAQGPKQRIGRTQGAPAEGKSAAPGPKGNKARIQIDLIQFARSSQQNDEAAYALIAVNVFTRQVFLRRMKDKEAETARKAIKHLIEKDENMWRGSVVSSDMGTEFLNERVKRLFEEYDIAHKTKAALGDQNAIAVADRAVQNLRQDITSRMEEGGLTFAEVLKRAERSYNERVHSAVRDAPSDVAADTPAGKTLRFLALRDNAAKYQHNNELAKKRVAKLNESKTFRTPLEGGAFGRSFNARWGGKQKMDGNVQAGTLVKGQNSEVLRDIKSIQVVPIATGADPQGVANARTQKDAERRQLTLPIRDRIKERIGEVGRRMALTTFGRELPSFFGAEFERMMGGRRLREIIALHPDLKLEEARTDANRINYYVKRVR